MLVEGQKIELRWSSSNKKWYESKGYNYTGMGDSFVVNATDLSNGSSNKVKVECDYCNGTFEMKYNSYHHHVILGKTKKAACKNCKSKKIKESETKPRYLRFKDTDPRKLINKCRKHQKDYDYCYPIQDREFRDKKDGKLKTLYFVTMELINEEMAI